MSIKGRLPPLIKKPRSAVAGRQAPGLQKQKIFEDIVRFNGLGSLVQFRILHSHNGTRTDLPFGAPHNHVI